MGKFKTGLIALSAIIAVFSLLAFGSFDNTSANFNHHYGCRPYDAYGVKSHDGEDNHANFNFHNNDKEVNIWADPGYTITGVWLDLHNGSDNFIYFGASAGNYDPNGHMTIDRAKAHVVKNCPTQTPSPSPTPTATASPTPVPSASVVPTGTPDPSATPEQTPVVDPTPTADPNDKCTNIDGVQSSIPDGWFQISNNSTFCRQFEYGGPQQSSDNTVTQTEPQGQVLGASTMADAGSFAETFYQAIMGIGGTLTAFGAKGLKKGKKNVKKVKTAKKSSKKASKKVKKA